MGIIIAKWGNGLGLRIPALTLEKAGLRVGDRVDAEVQWDRAILIQAAQGRRSVNIVAMIEKITPASLPDAAEIDARPVGREAW